jgi:hypothetical protein
MSHRGLSFIVLLVVILMGLDRATTQAATVVLYCAPTTNYSGASSIFGTITLDTSLDAFVAADLTISGVDSGTYTAVAPIMGQTFFNGSNVYVFPVEALDVNLIGSADPDAFAVGASSVIVPGNIDAFEVTFSPTPDDITVPEPASLAMLATSSVTLFRRRTRS